MESSSKHKRMPRFILHQLETGCCPGVTWVSREEGTFKIPWYHFNKTKRQDLPERFKIFVEWARHTGKFKDGDVPQYSDYKTQFRCALTKLEDFEEVYSNTERHVAHPYKVYRFRDRPDAGQAAVSPDSTVFDDVVSHGSTSLQALAEPSVQAPHSPVFFPTSDHRPVYADPASETYISSLVSQTDPLYTHPGVDFLDPDFSPSQEPASSVLLYMGVARVQQETMGPSEDNCIETSEPGIPVNSIFPTTTTAAAHVVPIADELQARETLSNALPAVAAIIQGERSPVSVQTSSNVALEEYDQFSDLVDWVDGRSAQAQAAQLPQDLEAIPWTALMPALPPGEIHVPFRSNPEDIPRLPHTSDVELQCGPAEVLPCGGMPQAGHEMTVILYYGQPKVKVMEETVGAEGCRLYFGDKVFKDTLLDEPMYGSRMAKQLCMPPVDKSVCKTERVFDMISSILGSLSRGLTLTFQDGDIYGRRLGHCRIFAVDADYKSCLLERKADSPVKVFDFHKFKEQTEFGAKPAPYFILTFAIDVSPTSRRNDPLEKVLVHAFVYHCAARKLQARLQPHVDEDSLGSTEPMFSDLNSMDKLEQTFRQMSTQS